MAAAAVLIEPTEQDQRVGPLLSRHGWGEARRHALAGDASARRYERLTAPDGGTIIFARSPSPYTDIVPFIKVGGVLERLGFSVPAILAAEAEQGLMLVEDFGDDTFSRRLDAGDDAQGLYGLAVDTLIELHRRFRPVDGAGLALPYFDAAMFIDQVMLFADTWLPLAFGRPASPGERAALEAAWWQVVPGACRVPSSLLLRDYHVDNLMLLPSRHGIRACGLLDFQNAGLGPVTYDLVSLIEDARRDVPTTLGNAMTERYLAAFPDLDRDTFLSSADVLAAIRHTRIIGIFARLAVQENRCSYLRYLPRVWHWLEGRLARPALAPVAAWFKSNLGPGQRAGLSLGPEAVPDGATSPVDLVVGIGNGTTL